MAARRADWRFLLPPGRHDRVGVWSDLDLGWMADDGWCHEVVEGSPSAGRVDVAYVDDPGSVADACAAVADDGVVVLRHLRSRGRAPGAALAALGFDAQRCYLLAPDPSAVRRYVPLDHRAGLGWLVADGPATAGARGALTSLAARSPGLVKRIAAGVLVVATKHSTEGLAALADTTKAGASDAILITSGFDEGSRAVLLPLTSAQDAPVSVVKIAARPSFNDNVDREVATVDAVRSELGDASDLVAPAELAGEHRGLRRTIESYAGRSTATDILAADPGADRAIEVLGTVGDAVATLGQRTVRSLVTWDADATERYLTAPFAELDALTHQPDPVHRLVASIAQAADALSGASVPLVRRHFDLGPWNVVFDGQRVSMVDWETAPPRPADGTGLGGADGIYFAKYWAHAAARIDTPAAELDLFAHRSAGADAAHPQLCAAQGAQIDRLFGTLGIDRRFVPLIEAHTWIESALYTAERRRRGGVVDPGATVRYLEALALDADRYLAYWD